VILNFYNIDNLFAEYICLLLCNVCSKTHETELLPMQYMKEILASVIAELMVCD